MPCVPHRRDFETFGALEPQAATLRPGLPAQHLSTMLKTMNCNRGNPDVTGFVLNQVGRGVLFNAAYFSWARFFSEQAWAGRAVEEDNDREPTPAPTQQKTARSKAACGARVLRPHHRPGTIACLMPVGSWWTIRITEEH